MWGHGSSRFKRASARAFPIESSPVLPGADEIGLQWFGPMHGRGEDLRSPPTHLLPPNIGGLLAKQERFARLYARPEREGEGGGISGPAGVSIFGPLLPVSA